MNSQGIVYEKYDALFFLNLFESPSVTYFSKNFPNSMLYVIMQLQHPQTTSIELE